MSPNTSLAELLQANETEILKDWLALQKQGAGSRRGLIDEAELARQSEEFLRSVTGAYRSGATRDMQSPAWAATHEQLRKVSEARTRQGFSSSDTANFIFSLKQAIFNLLRKGEHTEQARADLIWETSAVFDALGLLTVESYQKAREGVIARQQQEMMELSTPVVTLWKGILALPLIGTLDSQRTQVVMESLLQRIVETGSMIAILDITGVPTVDTLVAQHLLKTVAAARLMGADCIISGIRPQIAQTIVHLGVDLNSVTTKSTLADAYAVALRRANLRVVSTAPARPIAGPVAHPEES